MRPRISLLICVILAIALCAIFVACSPKASQTTDNVDATKVDPIVELQGDPEPEMQIPPHDHAFVDGICTICGLDEGLQYAVQDEAIIITGYIGDKTRLSIPATIDGKGVTAIGGRAFRNNTTLTSIVVPEGVAYIGEQAFAYDSVLGDVCNKVITQLLLMMANGEITNLTTRDQLVQLFRNQLSGNLQYVSEKVSAEEDAIYLVVPQKPYRGWLHEVSIFELYTQTDRMTFAFDGVNGRADVEEPPLPGPVQQISLPNSITYVGAAAFGGCESLVFNEHDGALYLGNTKTPYVVLMTIEDKEIEESQIAESTKVIYDRAFEGCTELTSITIPESVTAIGNYAFLGCNRLVEVYNKSSLYLTAGDEGNGFVAYYAKNVYTTAGGSKLFLDEEGYLRYTDGDAVSLFAYRGTDTELTIPNDVTEINQYAFDGYTGLTSIAIPESVTSIGSNAFSGCSGLTSVVVPESVSSIGNYAFYGCSGLTSITIGDGVISIGDGAFYGCNNIKVIRYAGDIAGWCAMSGLDNLMEHVRGTKSLFINGILIEGNLVIPDSVTSIGRSAFSECTGLTSITIPESVTSIGNYAFYGCIGLTSITIPESVTSIGNYAFSGCSGLTSILGNATNVAAVAENCGSSSYRIIITAGDSLGAVTFRRCYGLTSIVISKSVTSIGFQAFAACNDLTSVSFAEGSQLISIGNYAFRGCSGLLSIAIPAGATTIGEGAFDGCYNLAITLPQSINSIQARALAGVSAIEYLGTQAQWQTIEKETDWDGGRQIAVTCTDGIIE